MSMQHRPSLTTESDQKSSALRFLFGTLIFGSILIILTCYWIISAENRVVWELTDFSIFPTVLFTFFLLALITPFLKKAFKGFAPTSRELAMTYVMVSVATALAGHDIVRQLVPMIANAGWFAPPKMNGRISSSDSCRHG